MTTTPGVPNAVVINHRMSDAFERQAYREGFVTSQKVPSTLFLDNPPADDSSNTELSLGALVMFGKLYLDMHAVIGNRMCFRAEGSDDKILLNYTRLWNLGVIGFSEKGNVVQDSEIGESYFGQQSLLLDHQSLAAYATLIDDYISVNGEIRELRLFRKFLPILLGVTRQLEPGVLEDERNFGSLMGKLIAQHPELYDILDGYIYDFFRLLRTSQKYGCPIQSNCRQIKAGQDVSLPSSDTHSRLYQIVLEEHCTFPYPRTISSALKLCEDKRVKNFREQLLCWSKLVLEGSSDESKIRLEIRKAKKDLERLDTYKKVGRILAFVSIPVALASILTGLPLGLSLLPVGPVMAVDAMRREKQQAWLMFGKP